MQNFQEMPHAILVMTQIYSNILQSFRNQFASLWATDFFSNFGYFWSEKSGFPGIWVVCRISTFIIGLDDLYSVKLPKKSICGSPSLPTRAVRPQFWFWWLKLQKNEKTKFFKLPDWQWWKLLTSTPLTYVLENCLKYDISDGEHGNVDTFVSRGILVSKNSQKRQKSHFWWPRKLFLWLCPHHLRARANFFTTFRDLLNQPTFQRTTS